MPEREITAKQTNRIVYFDYLRIFAIIAVMLLHAASANWSKVDVNGRDWFFFNLYDSITRWGVPVLVMISGALFLGKKEVPIKDIWLKYVLRMLIAFVVWSFIYYIGVIQPKENFIGLFLPGKFKRVIKIISSSNHLWFVPMIAGLYICLPVVRKIAEDEKISNYYLAISFVFWFLLPQIKQLTSDFGGERAIAVVKAVYGNIADMKMNFVCSFVFYFILGYKLSVYDFKAGKRIAVYILGLLGFAFTIIVDLVLALKTQTPVQTYYDNNYINVMLEAVAVFVLFKHIPFKQSAPYKRIVVTLSKWSFGAYLVHILVLKTLRHYGIDSLRWNSAVATPLVALMVFVISFMISGVLNQIPVIKKYIV